MNSISWSTYRWPFSLAMLVYQKVYLQSLWYLYHLTLPSPKSPKIGAAAIGGYSQGLKRWGKALNQWGWVKPFWKNHRLTIKHPINIPIGQTLDMGIYLVCLGCIRFYQPQWLLCRMHNVRINPHQSSQPEQTQPNLWPLPEQERTQHFQHFILHLAKRCGFYIYVFCPSQPDWEDLSDVDFPWFSMNFHRLRDALEPPQDPAYRHLGRAIGAFFAVSQLGWKPQRPLLPSIESSIL